MSCRANPIAAPLPMRMSIALQGSASTAEVYAGAAGKTTSEPSLLRAISIAVLSREPPTRSRLGTVQGALNRGQRDGATGGIPHAEMTVGVTSLESGWS